MLRGFLYRVLFTHVLVILMMAALSQPATITGQPPRFNPAIASFRKTMQSDGSIFQYNATAKTKAQQLVVAGTWTVNVGNTDLYYPLLSRFTQDGDHEWSVLIGPGPSPMAQIGAVTAIHITSSGEILAAGFVNTDKSKDIQYPYEDAFVTRISTTGEIIWFMTYDRNRADCLRENMFRPFQITEGERDEIIVAAEMFNCITEVHSLIVMKLDKAGQVVWSSAYLHPINLSYRSGIDIDRSRISFWGTSPVSNTTGEQYLDLFQFDYNTGSMVNRRSWQLFSFSNDPENSFGGNVIRSQRLKNGNIQVYGTTAKAYDNFSSGRAHFSVIEFTPVYEFLHGYNIVPSGSDSGTVLLNITADENGMVLFNRLYKKSQARFNYAIGTAQKGLILHQRLFDHARSNFTGPEPLQIFDDSSFSFLNLYGQTIDFYTLNNNDIDTGCLGNTNPAELLFETQPVDYIPLYPSMPGRQTDTIQATDNSFHSIKINVDGDGNRINLGPDLIICQGNMVTIKAPPGFVSYQWNTGFTGNELIADRSGLYHCTVRDECGLTYKDSVYVMDKTSVELLNGKEITICKNERLQVQAETGFSMYRWGPEYNMVSNPASSSLIATPGTDTIYYVQAENESGCIFMDTIIVKVKQAPAFTLGPDKKICPGDSLVLSPSFSFRSYVWSTGSTSRDIRAGKSGHYILTAYTAEGCMASDTVTITLNNCGSSFFMPNAFTPNYDGLNDQIRPVIKGNVVQYKLFIYNRWGQVVFSSSGLAHGWDGKIKGQMQDPQTYSWLCTWQLEGGEVNMRKGSVTLIR
jgi:gliding motility-associated-like protein